MEDRVCMGALTRALQKAQRRRGLPSPAERKLLRLRAGLTQHDVAQALGVTVVSICRYETGKRDPRGTILDQYLEILRRLSNEKTP